MQNNKGKLIGGNQNAKVLDEMPDYSNPVTRETESKMGPFKFEEDDQLGSKPLLDKGPYELNNGAVYNG